MVNALSNGGSRDEGRADAEADPGEAHDPEVDQDSQEERHEDEKVAQERSEDQRGDDEDDRADLDDVEDLARTMTSFSAVVSATLPPSRTRTRSPNCSRTNGVRRAVSASSPALLSVFTKTHTLADRYP